MAIHWGSWQYSGSNGMRVGVAVSWSRAYNGSGSATATVKIYIEDQHRYADLESLAYSGGSISGSKSFANNYGRNGTPDGLAHLIDTQTYTYSYGSSQYGSSPSTRTFTVKLSGAYNGVTPNVTYKSAVPGRPYGTPAAPTSVTVTRPTNNSAKISWTPHSTAGAPYSSLTVWYRVFSGYSGQWSDWHLTGNTTAGATNLTTSGLNDNYTYQWQVRSNGRGGSSGWVTTTPYYSETNPNPPKSVHAAVTPDGSAIKVTWVPDWQQPVRTPTFTIWRSVNGAASTLVKTGATGTTWTDPDPGAGSNAYKVYTKSTLQWDYGSINPTVSNLVNTIVPPLAPTKLQPNGSAADLDNIGVTLTWQPNDGGDGADQSHFTIQYSADGGSTWTTLAGDVASTASSYVVDPGVLPNGITYQWRVRGEGVVSVGYGPYSAVAILVGSAVPVVTLHDDAPPATTITGYIHADWDYAQDQSSPEAQWIAYLYDGDGNLLETQSGTDPSNSVIFATRDVDGADYEVQVVAQSGAGLWSDPAVADTTVNIPTPAVVTLTPEYQPCTGTTVLHMEGEDPLPAEVRTNLATNPAMRATSGTVTVDTNYFPDPSFDYGSAGGSDHATATYEQSADQHRSGAHSLKITALTNGASPSYIGVTNSGALSGSNVTASAYVWVPAANTSAATTIRIGGTGVTAADSDPVDLGLRDQWQRISVTVPVVGTGSPALSVAPPSVSGEVVYVTDVVVSASGQVVDFFSGDTPADDTFTYSWTGTPGVSTSVKTARQIAGWGDTRTYQVGNDQAHVSGDVYGQNIPASLGDSYAIRVTLTNNGTAVAPVTYSLRGTVGAAFSGGSFQPSTVNVLAGQTVTVTATVTLSGSDDGLRPYFSAPSVSITDLLVEKVSGPSVEPGPYFDGDTPDGEDPGQPAGIWDYEWTGTPDASTSTATRTAEAAGIDHAEIQRRIVDANGQPLTGWVMLADDLQLPNDLLDSVPQTNGINEYQAISVSGVPAYRANEPVFVLAPTGDVYYNTLPDVLPFISGGSLPDSKENGSYYWSFLSYGDGWGNVLRFQGEPNVSETSGLSSTVQPFLGRAKPVLFVGENTSRGLAVQGTLTWSSITSPGCDTDDPNDCRFDSPGSDFVQAGLDAGIVCFRDYTGRRVFGGLSGMDVTDTYPGQATVGFTVTEVDYTEDYGPTVDEGSS